MAEQIQATIYRINGALLSNPSSISFSVTDILIKEFLPPPNTYPAQSIIQYYDTSESITKLKIFEASESFIDLFNSTNTGCATHVKASIISIENAILDSSTQYSFPISELSIWPFSDNGINSFIEFKGIKYYASETETDLITAANAGCTGSGTVTSVSVTTANGFAGSVATSSTTPTITLNTTVTGIVKGDGTSISAAVAGDFPTLNQNTTGNAATATLASTVTTNANLNGDVTSIGNTTSIASGVIVDADVNASAAIAVSKLAALTVSRAVVTNGSGVITPATTTATEIGFVNGVTSAIQTQLNNKQTLDATLTALAAYNTNGILTQTAADTFTGRTLTGTSNRLSITNGNGVSGNPTFDVDANYVGQSTITTTGTVTTGTWNAPIQYKTVTKTADYTMVAGDCWIAITNTLAPRTITLPSASAVGAGYIVFVSDETGAAAANNITVTRAGGDNIDGGTTSVIATGYGVKGFKSNGSAKWFLILDTIKNDPRLNPTPTGGGKLVYDNGISYSETAAGIAGQELRSNGTSSPIWATAGGSVISFFLNTAQSFVTNGYIGIAGDGSSTVNTNITPWVVPVAGTLSNLRVVGLANVPGNLHILIYKASNATSPSYAATALDAFVTVGTNTNSDTTHTVSVAAGDLIVAFSSAAWSANGACVNVMFTPT